MAEVWTVLIALGAARPRELFDGWTHGPSGNSGLHAIHLHRLLCCLLRPLRGDFDDRTALVKGVELRQMGEDRRFTVRLDHVQGSTIAPRVRVDSPAGG